MRDNILFLQVPIFDANEQSGMYPSIMFLANDLLEQGVDADYFNIDVLYLQYEKKRCLEKTISLYNKLGEGSVLWKIDGNKEEIKKAEVIKFAASFFANNKNEIYFKSNKCYYKNNCIDDLFNCIWKPYQDIIKLPLSPCDDLKTWIYRNRESKFYSMLEENIKKIDYNKYSLIGITVPLRDNLGFALLTCDFIKKNFPNVKIILGGAFFSTISEDDMSVIASLNVVDCIVKGCGRNSLRAILIPEKFDFGNCKIKKIIKTSEDIETSNGMIVEDAGRIPLDTRIREEIATIMANENVDGRISILHSQGCYWGGCTYCNYRTLYNSTYFLKRNSTAILSDIDVLYQKGFRKFYFICEAMDEISAKETAEHILKNEYICTWKSFLRCDNFDIETLRLIKKSGGSGFVFGMETINNRLLKMVNKGVGEAQIRDLFEKIKLADMQVEVNIIPDLPTSQSSEIIETLEFIQKYKSNICRLNISRFQVPYGCAMSKNPARYGLKLGKRGQYVNIPFIRISGVSGIELDKLVYLFYVESDSIYNKQLLSGLNLEKQQYINEDRECWYKMKTNPKIWEVELDDTMEIVYNPRKNVLFLASQEEIHG